MLSWEGYSPSLKMTLLNYFFYSVEVSEDTCFNNVGGKTASGNEVLFALYEHVKLLLPYDRDQAAFLRELGRINGRDMALDGCQKAQDLVY